MVAYNLMGKKEKVQQLTVNDLLHEPTNPEVKKKAKIVMKKASGASDKAPPSKAEEPIPEELAEKGDDWESDGSSEDVNPVKPKEPELTEDQKKMIAQVDKARAVLQGALTKIDLVKEELTGDLTIESFLKLRGEITAHTFMLFKDRKEELMNERIVAFKAENWDVYKEKIQQASHDFYQLSAQEMRFALNYLDILPENYALTMQKVMKEPGINKMCEENDMELRARLDHKDLTQSREEIKKIQMEVIEGEAAVA